jgi:hypothetical protein
MYEEFFRYPEVSDRWIGFYLRRNRFHQSENKDAENLKLYAFFAKLGFKFFKVNGTAFSTSGSTT